uniref:Uncharacterized protein n=1 Tax=Rhizophora mucronata TaxID=61149 RepID=A0A2P2J070_RHIMU
MALNRYCISSTLLSLPLLSIILFVLLKAVSQLRMQYVWLGF